MKAFCVNYTDFFARFVYINNKLIAANDRIPYDVGDSRICDHGVVLTSWISERLSQGKPARTSKRVALLMHFDSAMSDPNKAGIVRLYYDVEQHFKAKSGFTVVRLQRATQMKDAIENAVFPVLNVFEKLLYK